MHALALSLSCLAPVAAIVLWRMEIPALKARWATMSGGNPVGEVQEFLLILDVGFTIGNVAIVVAPIGLLISDNFTIAACMTGFSLLAIAGFASWGLRLKTGG